MKKPEDMPCARCAFRVKAQAKPRSLLGRLWTLHTRICPGWKRYQRAQRLADGRDAIGDQM